MNLLQRLLKLRINTKQLTTRVVGTIAPSMRRVLYTPTVQLRPQDIKKYYRTIFVLRRVITDLSKAIITKSSNPDFDELATKIALHLLLFSHVIIKKNDYSILDPEFCDYYVSSKVDPKLVMVQYKQEWQTYEYTYDEIVLTTIDTIGYFNPISMLDGIAQELQSFEYSRALMQKYFEAGITGRLAIILDSKGLNPTQLESERKAIVDTMIGQDNFGVPLVAFSDGAKGQIIELKGEFVSTEHIQFFEYITTAIATALGVPSDYVNQATKGSGLSDSRYKVTDYVYNQTIKGLQKSVMDTMKKLGIVYELDEPLREQDLLLTKQGLDDQSPNQVQSSS